MLKYTSIVLMMGLILLPTLGKTHGRDERPEARQIIAPFAALKDMNPNHDDLISLEIAVHISLQDNRYPAKTAFCCRSLADWGENLSPQHYDLAFLSFERYWRETRSADGTPNEDKAATIAQWTSQFMRPDYGERTFSAISDLVKKAILDLYTLEGDALKEASDSLFQDLRTESELQRSLDNPDTADWEDDSVVATLRDFLTDDE